MSALIFRTYAGAADLQAMIELIQSLRGRGCQVYPIAADLYEELADAEVQSSARLWEYKRQQLAGFAYVSSYQNLVDVFDPQQLTPALENELIAWAMSVVQRRNQEKSVTLTLDASTLETDLSRIEFLERHGFVRQAESSILMACPLVEPLPIAQLPPGFTIRPMGAEAELEAYVALHRAAFGSGNMTVEYRRAIISTPDYIPELDLVAVAPDGELAAFCVCQIFPDDSPRAGGNREGWTDPLGTHPAYRRRGLAKALILTGMCLLKKRGMDTAILGTSSENTAMQRTAQVIGFRAISNTLWYCKAV
ncbi:MAG: GNAT family N-acetyltransferase [Anaerolineales bacterium]|nr:GNAT family N-acetyltransferase [Anaerolineales bacterium]